MKKTITIIACAILSLSLLLTSCITSDSSIKGNQVNVTWKLEDTYSDQNDFKYYTPFEYNGIIYKEIPNAAAIRTLKQSELLLWNIDVSQMRILGKMKVRSSDSAYIPKEAESLFSYSQAYAFPMDESEMPLFIFCFNHLWCRDDIVVSEPLDCNVEEYSLFETRYQDSIDQNYRYCGKILFGGMVRDLFDFSTQKKITYEYNNSNKTEYVLKFYNQEYPFLYTEAILEKSDDGVWYWLFETSGDSPECVYQMLTEMSSQWNFLLTEHKIG